MKFGVWSVTHGGVWSVNDEMCMGGGLWNAVCEGHVVIH